MKKIVPSSIAVAILIIISLIVYFNDMQMNESLEIKVPKLAKRETIQLQERDIFNDEKIVKIFLSEKQMRSILKEIKFNTNWNNTKLDERLDERMNFYTREEIYNHIPNIENAYWIFTNRSNKVGNKHSIEELLEDMYYAVSVGILDTNNNVLYYYEYDR